MDNQQLWDSALIEIEVSVSKANFKTWFKDTFISKQEEGVIYLNVPSEFVRGWLQDKFHKLILKTLRSISDKIRSVDYVVSRERPTNLQNNTAINPALGKIELPLENFYVNKKDNLNPRYDFESFVVGSFNELAHAASQAVVKNPGGVYNPLFVYGPTGVGKTHLMQAIGNKIRDLYQNKNVYIGKLYLFFHVFF